MKNLLFLFLLFISGTSFSQNFDSIRVHILKEEIIIDNLTINKKTKIDQVIKIFGKAERVVEHNGQERILIYDSKGVAFNLRDGGDRQISAVTITYTYDNDENVASGKYTGKLIIDQLEVTEFTPADTINEKTDLNLLCMRSRCVTDFAGDGLLVLLGLTETNTILQMAFGLRP